MAKRWVQTLSKEKLRELTSKAASTRWAKISKEDRRAYALMMVGARKIKNEEKSYS